jgi:hypothetical protein
VQNPTARAERKARGYKYRPWVIAIHKPPKKMPKDSPAPGKVKGSGTRTKALTYPPDEEQAG